MTKHSDVDFEIAFYEGVLAEHAEYIDVLKVIGNLYTARGFFDKGLAVDLKLIRLCPADPVVFYNLACSYALTADPDQAFLALYRAFELGYREWQHMETDKDLKPIRNDPRYSDLIQRMQHESP